MVRYEVQELRPHAAGRGVGSSLAASSGRFCSCPERPWLGGEPHSPGILSPQAGHSLRGSLGLLGTAKPGGL